MKPFPPFLIMALALVALLAGPTSARAEAPPAPPYIIQPASFDAYVREPDDREWHLYFSGAVPVYSWAGAALTVHDADGRIIHREVIPRGIYPDAKPRVITIKPDGRTGDYRVVMVGHQIQFLGVCGTVWSDLPFESYGGIRTSLPRTPAARPWFKAPAGVTRMKLGSESGHLQVLNQAGTAVADTRSSPEKKKNQSLVEFAVTPGQAYQLVLEGTSVGAYRPDQPGLAGPSTNALIPDRLFLAHQPERWFQPSTNLTSAKFWKGSK